MSLKTRTLLGLVAGALAGMLTWILTDVTGLFTPVLSQKLFSVETFSGFLFLLYGGIFGLILGLLLSVVDSMSMNAQSGFAKMLAVGSAAGFASGFVGILFGQMIFGFLVRSETAGEGPLGLIGRAAGYAMIGVFVGASNGIPRKSWALAKQGAFGGFCGGLLGGLSFQLVHGIFLEIPHNDILGRLVALVSSGALVGYFVGLVQNVMKHAWVRVVLGKNEGAEHLLTRPITTIGRSELADIPLYGDPSIAPTHVAIESIPSQKRHRLRFVATADSRGQTFGPPIVNGQPVTSELWLADGDTIQLGRQTLEFHEKATKGGISAQLYAQAMPEAKPSVMPDEVPYAAPASHAAHYPIQSPATFAPPPTTVSQTGTRLIAMRGPYAGQSFPLSHAPASIGRAPECTISVPADTSVSRRHAGVSYIAGRHVVSDDGSSNGVQVNGIRIVSEQILNVGDMIQLGETAFRYE